MVREFRLRSPYIVTAHDNLPTATQSVFPHRGSLQRQRLLVGGRDAGVKSGSQWLLHDKCLKMVSKFTEISPRKDLLVLWCP